MYCVKRLSLSSHKQELFFQLFMHCFQRLSQDGRENPIWTLSFLSKVSGRAQQIKQQTWSCSTPSTRVLVCIFLSVSNAVGVVHFKSSALWTSFSSLAQALGAEWLAKFLLKGCDKISGCFPITTTPDCWTPEPCSRMPAADHWSRSELVRNMGLTYC